MKKRRYRNLEQKIEETVDTQHEFSVLMALNFPSVRPGQVSALSCANCMQYRQKACTGEERIGYEVIQCMIDHYERGEMGVIMPSMN